MFSFAKEMAAVLARCSILAAGATVFAADSGGG